MEKDLDFFFNNNASQAKKRNYKMKKIKPYNTPKIKLWNFLTNISYNGVKETDLFDRSFVLDVYLLTIKNINPFSLEQKIFDVKNRETIHMFWEDCNQLSFYKRICNPENLMYLNDKNVIYSCVADIVWNYIEENEKNFDKPKKKLTEIEKTFQFVYSSAYPEIYSCQETRHQAQEQLPVEVQRLEGQKEVFTEIFRRLFLQEWKPVSTSRSCNTK